MRLFFGVQVEDFVDPNGRISLIREETPTQRWECPLAQCNPIVIMLHVGKVKHPPDSQP